MFRGRWRGGCDCVRMRDCVPRWSPVGLGVPNGRNATLKPHLPLLPSSTPRARGALCSFPWSAFSWFTTLIHRHLSAVVDTTKSINLLVLFNPGIKALPFLIAGGRPGGRPAHSIPSSTRPLAPLVPLLLRTPSKTGRPHSVQPLQDKGFWFHLPVFWNAVKGLAPSHSCHCSVDAHFLALFLCVRL